MHIGFDRRGQKRFRLSDGHALEAGSNHRPLGQILEPGTKMAKALWPAIGRNAKRPVSPFSQIVRSSSPMQDRQLSVQLMQTSTLLLGYHIRLFFGYRQWQRCRGWKVLGRRRRHPEARTWTERIWTATIQLHTLVSMFRSECEITHIDDEGKHRDFPSHVAEDCSINLD